MSTKNHLPMAARLALADLIRAEFTTSGMTDAEFATYAAGKIATGGKQLNRDHVNGLRTALSIPSNRPVKPAAPTAADTEALMALIEEQGKRIEKLEGQVFKLQQLSLPFGQLPGLGGGIVAAGGVNISEAARDLRTHAALPVRGTLVG